MGPTAGALHSAPPLTYSIDPQRGIVYVDLQSAACPNALRGAVHAMTADPRWSADFDVLVECNPSTQESDPQLVAGLARLWLSIPAEVFHGRCAVLADWPAAYERGLRLEALCRESSHQLRAFRSEGAAAAWLGELQPVA